MTQNEFRLYKNRFLVVLRIHGLLRNAKKFYKLKMFERAEVFIKESEQVIDAFRFQNKIRNM